MRDYSFIQVLILSGFWIADEERYISSREGLANGLQDRGRMRPGRRSDSTDPIFAGDRPCGHAEDGA